MNYWMRFSWILLASFWRGKLTMADKNASSTFRIWITDIDIFRHANNARYFTFMELCRNEFLLRCGGFKKLIKNGWITPIAEQGIEYIRPLYAFEKIRVDFELGPIEGKRLRILQRIFRGDELIARGYVVLAIKQGRTTIPPEQFLDMLSS